MMPATSATRPATSQTMTQIWSSEMPTDCAASWSSATARSARPIRVRWKNTREAGHQDRRRSGGRDVDLLQDDDAAERVSNMERRRSEAASSSVIMTSEAEDQLAEADQEEGQRRWSP